MRRDLRKINRQDYRKLFKVAVDDDKEELNKEDLDKEEETDNKESKDKPEKQDNSELGKDTPEEKEEESKDEEEELKQKQIDNPNQEPANKELIEHSIEQISNSGRSLLKEIEKFKFNLEQTSRMLSQSPQLSQGMMSKRKSVNEISNKLYQIIFDIENTDISLSFQQENPEATDVVRNDVRSVGEPKPQVVPAAPGGGPIPPNPNLNKKDEDENDKEDEDKEDEEE